MTLLEFESFLSNVKVIKEDYFLRLSCLLTSNTVTDGRSITMGIIPDVGIFA